MDILNIPALIAKGLLTDITQFDTTNAYLAVGIYTGDKTPRDGTQYPIWAIKVSDLITSGSVWGGITGSLPAQTDLQNALNAKMDLFLASNGLTPTGTTLKLGGDLTGNTSITGSFNLNLGTSTKRLNKLECYSLVDTTFKATNGTGFSTLGLFGSGGGFTATLQGSDGTNSIAIEAAPMTLDVIVNGGSSAFNITNNISGPLVGFFTSGAASPILQPTTSGTSATFAANTSGISNDSATFDGYTIGQVVKALRALGLLQ